MPKKKKRRLLKWTLTTLGVLVLLLVLVVALAPKIAAPFAPGLVGNAINTRIAGSVDIGAIRLSWFGSQHIDGLTLADPDGKPVGTLTADAEVALFDLLIGSKDLGTLRISGRLDIAADESGATNLQRALAPVTPGPATTGSKNPPRIPAGLKLDLRIDDMTLTYTSPAIAARTAGQVDGFAIQKIRGSGTLAPGSPLELSLRVETARIVDGATEPDSGWIAIEVRADSLIAADGLIDLSSLDGRVSVSAQSPIVVLNAEVSVTDGVATLVEPAGFALHTEALAELIPAVRGAFTSDVVTPDSLPEIEIRLTHLSAPIGGSLDDSLAGLRGSADLTLAEFRGSIVLDPARKAERMRVLPLVLTIDAMDPDGDVSVKGAGGARIAQQSAGSFLMDLQLSRLFADGLPSPESLLAGARGSITIDDLDTAVAEPLVSSFGIDLTKTVGPKLGVRITAARNGESTNLVIDVDSDNLTASGGFTITASGASVDSDGLVVFFRDAEPIARAVLSAAGADPNMLTGQSTLHLAVSQLDIPFGADHSAMLHRMRLHATMSLDGFEINGVEKLDDLAVRDLTLTLTQQDGQATRVSVTGRATVNHQPVDINGRWALANLRQELSKLGDQPDFTLIRPIGTLTLTGDGAALAATFIDDIELASLISDVVGPTTTLVLTTAALDDGLASLGLTVTSPLISVDLNAELRQDSVSLTSAGLDAKLTAETAQTLLRLADVSGLDARLAHAAKLHVDVEPITLPLDGLSIDRATAGDVTLGATATVDIALASLAFDINGSTTDLGPLRAPDAALTLSVPLAALIGQTPTPVNVALVGQVVGDTGKIVQAEFAGTTALRVGTPLTTADLSLNLTDIDLAWIESKLDAPSKLTDLLGATADVDLIATLPINDKTEATTISIDLRSPEFQTRQPLEIRIGQRRVGLTAPADLKITLSPEQATSLMFGDLGASPGAARVSAPIRLVAHIEELTLPRRRNVAAGDVLLIDATISAGSIPIAFEDGSSVEIRNWTARMARSDAHTDRVDFSIAADLDDDNPETAKQIEFGGHFSGFLQNDGTFDPSKAVITCDADLRKIPTALVDGRLHMDGFLLDLLGPTTSIRLTADGFGLGRGSVLFIAGSHRAGVRVSGSIKDDGFVLDDQTSVRISTISKEFGRRIASAVPVISEFYSTPEDRPASITTTGLIVPLDGDISKLDGTIDINPGVLRFHTDKLFGPILKAAKQDQSGFVGTDLKPLTVNINNGVISYKRYMLPLGEFSIGSEGSIDLVNRTLDMITWIPFGALTDEVAGQLNSGLGNMLGGAFPFIEKLTLVPIRVRGPMDHPKIEPDAGLFLQNTVDTIRPDKLIIEGLNELFGNKKKDQKK